MRSIMQARMRDLYLPKRWITLRVVVGIFLLACGITANARALLSATTAAQDAQMQTKIQSALKDKKYRNVTASVSKGVVTLSGKVDLYVYKLDAVKISRSVDGVHLVLDNLAVGGSSVSDQKLRQELLEKIQTNRVGFGQVFDAITVQVQDGVVTLGGHAVDPATIELTVSLVESMPGVRGIANKIQVDPLSAMDDQIRMAEFNAIYNYSPLSEYSMVPARPIRISVQNGNVTLYGVVGTQMDKDLVGLRASQVSGILRVTNDLMVASTPSKKQ